MSSPATEYRLSSRLITAHTNDGSFARAIQAVAAGLERARGPGGHRGFAICGVTAVDRLDEIAANLAVACGRLGSRTLLIDGDLARPSLQNFIEPVGSVLGLADLLSSDRWALDDVIQDEVLPNLSLMYAGTAEAPDRDLLGGADLVSVVQRCERMFDLTLISTPPANQSSDALRLAKAAGYAVVVARRNGTFLDDLETLNDDLKGVGSVVLGTILS